MNLLVDYKKQHDELVEDLARVREECDDYKDKFERVVSLFNRHLVFKLAVTNDGIWYIHLKHELEKILKGNEK